MVTTHDDAELTIGSEMSKSVLEKCAMQLCLCGGFPSLPSLPPSSNMNNPHPTSSSQLYSTSSQVPLIQSSSTTLPKPVTIPTDLHPLPSNLHDYFVYPFTLEPFLLNQFLSTSSSSSSVQSMLSNHQSFLQNLKKEKWLKLAPGYQSGKVLPLDQIR